LLDSSSSQLHAGRVSEQAGVYLGHLTGYVLRAVRYLVTPPLSLRIDPRMGYHEGTYADWRESSLVEATELAPLTTSSSSSGVNTVAGDSGRRGASVHAAAHAYEGESLYELTNAYLNYLYSNDPAAYSTNHVRRLMARQWERELAVWDTLLPAVLFPSKIDVVVYLVKLQNTYEPLGE
jgi:hypothetical protein